MLKKSVSEIQELPYDEIQGWFEYINRRPPGWQDDNRAAIQVMAMAGSNKVKPEDLFSSLKTIKDEQAKDHAARENKNVATKFFEKFAGKMSEKTITALFEDV